MKPEYQIEDADPVISVSLEGREVYRLEREEDGKGIWALYRISDGIKTGPLDHDQYRHDLIDRIKAGFYLEGQVRRTDHGYVIGVPEDASDFYISGLGYLCAKSPNRRTLSEYPVRPLGIKNDPQIIGFASVEQKLAVGLEPDEVALFLRDARPVE